MITSHNIAQNEIAKHRLAHGISVRTQIYQSLASLLDDMSPLTLNAVNKALAPYGAGITERDKNMYDDNSLRAEIARTMKELEKDGIVGVGELQSVGKEKVGGVLDASATLTETIHYPYLKTEHAELIKLGKTPVEIAIWIGEKLNIISWKIQAFHGERKALPTPTPEEMVRLQKFIEALGTSWVQANGGSNNYPGHLLLDGYVQNALFGQANMDRCNEALNIVNTTWQAMINGGSTLEDKTQYLFAQFGLIATDLKALTGVRIISLHLDISNLLDELMPYDGDGPRRIKEIKLPCRSQVISIDPSSTRLCVLA